MPASTSQSTLVDKLALPVLPLPDSLTSKLATLGVNPSAAQRIGVSLSQAAVRLRDSCVADFELRRDALRTRAQYFQDPKSLSLISSAYSTIYAKTIREWTSYLLDDVTPRVLRAHKAHSPSMSKRLFNQNAVPMLEAFFSHNAFPSRLEKHELASQCAMEYRQIHVWFQNRRSRFRKEGKELKRPVGTSSVLESLEKAVVDVLLPPDQGDEGGDDNDMLSTTTLDFLRLIQDDTPPAHAFPSLYPPLCSYEPFPTTSEKRALRTPWMRRPQSTIHTAGQAVDVTQLTSALAPFLPLRPVLKRLIRHSFGDTGGHLALLVFRKGAFKAYCAIPRRMYLQAAAFVDNGHASAASSLVPIPRLIRSTDFSQVDL
ncbi:hypothetical protein V8D89_012374 [Ganoderma adspersum]